MSYQIRRWNKFSFYWCVYFIKHVLKVKHKRCVEWTHATSNTYFSRKGNKFPKVMFLGAGFLFRKPTLLPPTKQPNEQTNEERVKKKKTTTTKIHVTYPNVLPIVIYMLIKKMVDIAKAIIKVKSQRKPNTSSNIYTISNKSLPI